jgi:hypothetical protein
MRCPGGWGPPLAFTCLWPCQCDATHPQAPTHTTHVNHVTPTVRSGEPCFPCTDLDTSWFPLLPYPSFPYLAPLLVRRPLVSVQDDEDGCCDLTQVIVLPPPRVISPSATSSRPCLHTTARHLSPSQGSRKGNITPKQRRHPPPRDQETKSRRPVTSLTPFPPAM